MGVCGACARPRLPCGCARAAAQGDPRFTRIFELNTVKSVRVFSKNSRDSAGPGGPAPVRRALQQPQDKRPHVPYRPDTRRTPYGTRLHAAQCPVTKCYYPLDEELNRSRTRERKQKEARRSGDPRSTTTWEKEGQGVSGLHTAQVHTVTGTADCAHTPPLSAHTAGQRSTSTSS